VSKTKELFVTWGLWVIAFGFVLSAAFVAIDYYFPQLEDIPSNSKPSVEKNPASQKSGSYQIPDFTPYQPKASIYRSLDFTTTIPERANVEPITHLVEFNDSLFALAEAHGLEPESILWSNYDVLQDNPHSLSPGMELVIPPIDGIYYEWQEGDDVDKIAKEFQTEPEMITNWIGNSLDLINPEFEPGMMVMIPEGKRELQQWIIPTIARGTAGVSSGVYGAGACSGPFEGLYGGGGFIWPTVGHTLSGNDYWSGHLAIDIGLSVGEPVFASDSGVIVFSGWSAGGYGNVVVVDHGTGYQTLYAHLSGVTVGCGQSVTQGQTIGLGGNTGNSTGAHLHFEVRFQGGFVNPWFVLPPP
jgi:hypothetical protein